MVEISQAIQRAIEFAEQIYASKLHQPRVEEVETTDAEWLITLSFRERTVVGSALREAVLGGDSDRQYKIFRSASPTAGSPR